MFGWVEFTEEERKRAETVMNMARYPGAIDELGIGVIRDTFSNLLFPATSTLHTHARYYYLVAYLMKDIERECAGKSYDVIQEMRAKGEKNTCIRLTEWEQITRQNISGITGKDMVKAGSWVKMTPASMDWAGIQGLGLFTDSGMSLSDYLKAVSRMELTSQKIGRDEENFESSIDQRIGSFWSVPLDSYKGCHGEELKPLWESVGPLSLWLTETEACDLKNRIAERFEGTLYAALLQCENIDELRESLIESEHEKEAGDVSTEDVIEYLSFIRLVDSGIIRSLTNDKKLLDTCECAANFSAFASMLHIRFNYIIRSSAEIDNLENDIAYQRWKKYYFHDEYSYHNRTMNLDLNQVFDICNLNFNSNRNSQTKQFLEGALTSYREKDLASLDKKIAAREETLKGRMRSKINNPQSYTGVWLGGIELTYRLRVALMVISEIQMALKKEKEND